MVESTEASWLPDGDGSGGDGGDQAVGRWISSLLMKLTVNSVKSELSVFLVPGKKRHTDTLNRFSSFIQSLHTNNANQWTDSLGSGGD